MLIFTSNKVQNKKGEVKEETDKKKDVKDKNVEYGDEKDVEGTEVEEEAVDEMEALTQRSTIVSR